jgi:hypothetical protein
VETLPEQVRRLTEEITELKARWPAHSVQAWQVLQLEELEEQLATLQAQIKTNQTPRPNGDST